MDQISVCILLKVALLFMILATVVVALLDDDGVEPPLEEEAMLWSLSLVFKDVVVAVVPPANEAGGVRITLAKRMG